MRNMLVGLVIISLSVISFAFMPGTVAEILAQMHVPTQAEPVKLPALNTKSWGIGGPSATGPSCQRQQQHRQMHRQIYKP